MRAYILVDPVQDYEESLDILGVFGTYFEAAAAHEKDRKLGHFAPGTGGNARDAEIQLWDGPIFVKRWQTRQTNLQEMMEADISRYEDGFVYEYEWKVIR